MLTKFILFLKYIGPRGAPLNTIFTFVSRIMWIFGVTGLIFNHLMGIIPHHLMGSVFKGRNSRVGEPHGSFVCIIVILLYTELHGNRFIN